MKRRWTADEEEWMRLRYGSTDVHELADEFEERFGHRRSERALYVKASNMGLRRAPTVRTHAARAVRWSSEPEMEAFMLAHDRGSCMAISEKFERRFGFPLTQSQVTGFRVSHGTQSKAGREHAHDWHRCPVGAERERHGYVYVKVAEEPSAPGARDNWRPKHDVAWEREHGMSLPEGMAVVFADRDRSNFDPSNLVAVPKKMMAQLNVHRADWFDAESLRACMALCRIDSKVLDAACAPRRCAVCGREFVPRNRGTAQAQVRTCPECVDAGHRPTHAATIGQGMERDLERGDARG